MFTTNTSVLHVKSRFLEGAVDASLGSRKETMVGDKAAVSWRPRRRAVSMKLKIHGPGSIPATRATLSSVEAQLRSMWMSGTEADASSCEAPC